MVVPGSDRGSRGDTVCKQKPQPAQPSASQCTSAFRSRHQLEHVDAGPAGLLADESRCAQKSHALHVTGLFGPASSKQWESAYLALHQPGQIAAQKAHPAHELTAQSLPAVSGLQLSLAQPYRSLQKPQR